MRGSDLLQGTFFSWVDMEERIPASHPLRPFKKAVDLILKSMSPEFDKRYSAQGRPSIAPERLMRAALLQVIFTIRSERQLMEQIDYNLLFRWFVGLGIDDPVWERTTFCANRDRLLNDDVFRLFFNQVLLLAEWAGVTSDEHFSVDGTLIEAWASQKSLVRIDGGGPNQPPGPGRNPEVDFHGETFSNDTHRSRTDPDARIYKKSKFTESKLRHITHLLMENRNGLVVDVETTQAHGRAEREAALTMAERTLKPGSTLGADRGYDVAEFLELMDRLGVEPHVAAKRLNSAVPEVLRQNPGYVVSLRIRKRIEECFGWAKTVGGFRKTRFVGTAKVQAQALMTFSAWNLTRLATLLGWRNAMA